jgi:hypothetical protein
MWNLVIAEDFFQQFEPFFLGFSAQFPWSLFSYRPVADPTFVGDLDTTGL